MLENETAQSADAYLASDRQKSRAIKKHYDVVTDPQSPADAHDNSLRALGVLSKDTGRKIIISLLDKINRQQKLKNIKFIEGINKK